MSKKCAARAVGLHLCVSVYFCVLVCAWQPDWHHYVLSPSLLSISQFTLVTLPLSSFAWAQLWLQLWEYAVEHPCTFVWVEQRWEAIPTLSITQSLPNIHSALPLVSLPRPEPQFLSLLSVQATRLWTFNNVKTMRRSTRVAKLVLGAGSGSLLCFQCIVQCYVFTPKGGDHSSEKKMQTTFIIQSTHSSEETMAGLFKGTPPVQLVTGLSFFFFAGMCSSVTSPARGAVFIYHVINGSC